MNIIKTIDPDIDIDYRGNVDYKGQQLVFLYLVVFWSVVAIIYFS